MENKELSISLREIARSQKTPLCDEWYNNWKDDTSIDELLEKYIKGFDFAVKNDYPSLEFSRKVFDKADLHRHNIFLDENVNVENASNGYYVFLGNSSGKIIIDGFKAVTVYVRHDSSIDVRAFNGAMVTVFYYDKSTGNTVNDEFSRIKSIVKNRT